jgi:tetratricopeptide (TPR) repeat protein
MRRIFVSSTSRDLESCRRLAVEALRRRGHLVDDQAIFDLTYQEIFEKLEHRIGACDAVVCLIGFAYGGEPSNRPADQPRRSYTQWEYFLARKLGKPVYLLLAGEGTTPDNPVSEPDELCRLQLAYRAEVIVDRDWRSFTSKDQLRADLAELRFPWEPRLSDHRPCNLPFETLGELFKGRGEFLADLRRRLVKPNGRAAAIVGKQAVHGLGGVGKTRAAIEYGWEHAGDYSALLFISAPSAGELRANLANLVGLLAIESRSTAVDHQVREVLHWLDVNPGWLLIVDNVDSDDAAHEIERLLAKLRTGHVLITSRISNWSAGVEPLELSVLAEPDAMAFLLERTAQRRKKPDDDARAGEITRELGGLALGLEQAGAYIDKLRLSFDEYLARWRQKRPEVLRWHDQRLMQYPASVAITWETTFAQLPEPEQRLLQILAWLAPEPIPLFLFDAEPLAGVIPEPREALAGLAAFSLARLETIGDVVVIHRLVQEVARGRGEEATRRQALEVALNAVIAMAGSEPPPDDIRSWPVWTPLATHADAVATHADAAQIVEPTAPLMNGLGLYLQARCRFQQAEPLYRRALAIDEASYGPEHPHVARDLNNLAFLLSVVDRLPEAEPLMRRALTIEEASYGPDHPRVAGELSNLAQILKATNRLAEAEPLMRRALAICEASYGPDHPDVARMLNNLARLLEDTARLGEAKPLFRRALAINEASYGPDHPAVALGLNNLAQVLLATNRQSDAEPLFRRALAICEASYGPDHPDVATLLNNLGQLLQDTNRLEEAETLMRRALAIVEASYGPDHQIVASRLSNLALLLRATSRLPEAEPLSRRSVEIVLRSQKGTGHAHPQVRTCLKEYALLLRAMGHSPAEVRERLEALCRLYGVDSVNPFGFVEIAFKAPLGPYVRQLPEQ